MSLNITTVPPTLPEQSSEISTGVKFLLCFIVFFAVLSTMCLTPVLPAFLDYFSVCKDTAQRVSSYSFLGLAFSGIFYGPLSDYYGRKKILLTAYSLFVIFSCLSAFATTIEELFLLQFLSGFQAGAGSVVTLAIVKDRFDGAEAAKLISSMGLVTPLAPALAPLFGGYIKVLLGWQALFLTLSGMAFVVVVCIALFMPETNPAAEREKISLHGVVHGFIDVLSNRSFLGYSLVLALIFGGLQAYYVTSSFMFILHFNVPTQTFGYYQLISGLGVVGGNFIVHRWVATYGLVKLYRLVPYFALTAAVLFLALVALDVRQPLPYALTMIIFGIALGLGFSTAVPLAMSTVPRAKGYTSSVTRSIQMLGAFVGTIIIAELYNSTFWPTALALLTFSASSYMVSRLASLR